MSLSKWQLAVNDTTLAEESTDRIKMTDQEFRDMLLAVLTDIKEQGKERYDRLEKRLDAIESQAKENNDRLEKRLDSTDTRLGRVEQDVGWIKGKLEGK